MNGNYWHDPEIWLSVFKRFKNSKAIIYALRNCITNNKICELMSFIFLDGGMDFMITSITSFISVIIP